MINRIEIGLKEGVPDARGRGVIHRAEGALKMALAECRTRDVYKVVAEIDDATAGAVQKTFAVLVNHQFNPRKINQVYTMRDNFHLYSIPPNFVTISIVLRRTVDMRSRRKSQRTCPYPRCRPVR